MPTHRTRARHWISCVAALALAACQGPPGPRGEQGPPGPAGSSATLDASAADASAGLDASAESAVPRDGAPADGGLYDPRAICQSCHPGLNVSRMNLVGIHNPESARYLGNCLHCHADIVNRTTLDPNVPNIHRRMIPYTGTFNGVPRNQDCLFCHRTVEFGGNHSGAELRRQVATVLCTGCHHDGRYDYYLP